MKNKIARNKTVDVIKALGICFVVMGHTGSEFGGYLYTFHMGLFFFVSGYLLYGKRQTKVTTLLWNKCRSVLIPYVLFWSVSMIVSQIRVYLYMHTFDKLSIQHFLGLILGGHWLADYSINFPLWYLQLYFIAAVIFEIFILKLSDKWKVVVLFFVVLITVPFQNLIPGRPAFHINVLPAALAFMIMGHLFHSTILKYTCRKQIPFGICLLVIGWRISTIYYGNIAHIGNNLYFVGAICTIIGFYYLSEVFSKNRWAEIFCYIGQKTLWIMGMHNLVTTDAYEFVDYMFDVLKIENPFIVNICTVLVVIAVCCAMAEAVEPICIQVLAAYRNCMTKEK